MQFTDRPSAAVALVYQSQALHQHLRAALDEFGAHVVYETSTASFLPQALADSGANVIVINLDPAIDEEIAQIEDLLVDDSRKVIFNDGEVTSKLSGWDLARWARHLAAKIIGDTQLLPARPVGAEAVPVRDMPQHALDSAIKPVSMRAPVVTGEAEDRATREISAALSNFAVGNGEAKDHTQARHELEAALNDFGFFSEDANHQSVNDLAAIAPEPSVSVAAVAAPALVPDFTLQEAAVEEMFEPEFVTQALPERTQQSATAPSAADELFADFDFSDTSQGVQATADTDALDDSAFADIQFDFDAEPDAKPAADRDVSKGLDDFLQQHTFKEQDVTVELPIPASLAKAARKPAVDVDSLMSGLSFELSPIEEPAAPQPAVEAIAKPSAAAPVREEMSSAFDDMLSALSLQPIDNGTDAAPAAAAPASQKSEAEAVKSPFDGLSFELEPTAVESEAEANPFASLNFAEAVSERSPASSVAATRPAAATASMAAREEPTSGLSGSFSRVWVLGASIGGPDAVREFLSGIPRSTTNLFLLAQHMGADFIDLMVTQLAKATHLEVKMATNGSAARPGQVLVVPLAERLLLGADGDVRVVPLDQASPYSPSIDQVLFDVADRFGARAGAIIFSGMAHDAIEGAKHLAAKGGIIWVQDPATCVVSSMIDGALEAGIVRYQGGPTDLAQKFAAEFG